jgi:hypothetical protein
MERKVKIALQISKYLHDEFPNMYHDIGLRIITDLDEKFGDDGWAKSDSSNGLCESASSQQTVQNAGWFLSSEIKPNDGEIIDIWIDTGEAGGRIPDCTYDKRGFCTIKKGLISEYPDQDCVTYWRRKPERPGR